MTVGTDPYRVFEVHGRRMNKTPLSLFFRVSRPGMLPQALAPWLLLSGAILGGCGDDGKNSGTSENEDSQLMGDAGLGGEQSADESTGGRAQGTGGSDSENDGSQNDGSSGGTSTGSGGDEGSQGTGGEDTAAGSGGSEATGGSEQGTGGTSAEEPTVIVLPDNIDADCAELVTDPDVNWRESATLQTDQEIVGCLAASLGAPVGYGEEALGGFDPNGNSELVVITKGGDLSVEQQLAAAVGSSDPKWVVFDKADFAETTDVALYRLHCENTDVLSALGTADSSLCLDHEAWCEDQGVASADCLETFFNERLNDGDLPIRNVEIGSNTTLDGRQSQARILFSGFAIGADSGGEPVRTAESVIVTNILFQGAGHTEDHDLDPDMLRTTGASNKVWIHQNTFDLTGDSAFDVKVGAHHITMSFNLVRNVKRAALHGSNNDRLINADIRTTMHNNAFVTTDDLYDFFGNTGRRVPLLRRGRSHMFNNVFYGYRKDIMSVRFGAQVVFEDNMFLANPAVSGDDDSEYYQENLLTDVRDDSGLAVSGTEVWFANADFELDTSTGPGDLDATVGEVSDLAADYSDASRAVIEQERLLAGQGLVDYVMATAGKGGQTPFNAGQAPQE